MEAYVAQIEKWAVHSEYKNRVDSLICYRGISVLSAMKIITEIGDIRRFQHPRALVSYLGLDISEYSSGGKHRRFSITKMGNKRVRTTLVESCQTAGRRPAVSKPLRKRRSDIDAEFISVSERCMQRLYKKYLHLTARGKCKNKAIVACAREMTGFVWESLRKAS